MKKKELELYESPTSEVVEINATNSILTASKDQYDSHQW